MYVPTFVRNFLEQRRTDLMFKEIMAADTQLYPHAPPSPYNPDMLAAVKGGLRIYDKMRRDDAIKSCMGLKKYAVLSSGWGIEPASQENIDLEISEFVEDSLTLIRGSFDDVLLQIMTAFDYGFSVTEKIHYAADNGKIMLQALKTRKPHGIDFDRDVFGNLKEDGVIQANTDHMPANKFIIYSHNDEFNNWYGESDLRSCYRAWWSKDCIIKFWNIFLERYGMPPAIAKLTKPLKNESADKSKIENILRRLQSATSAILPEGIDLEFPTVKGEGAKSYQAAIQAHDMAIARSLLVPNLLGLSAKDNTGSYSQSQTHFNIFLWIILKLRRTLEELVFENIIRELVDYNFRTDQYPKFIFLPIDSEKKVELAKLWLQAVKDGSVTSNNEDENLLRKILGWPEREEEEEIESDNEPYSVSNFSLNRKPNSYEKRVNFKRIEKSLDDLEGVSISQLTDILVQQRDILKSFLEKKFNAGSVDARLINSLQLKYLRPLQQSIKEMLHEGYRIGQKELSSEIGKTYRIKLPPIYAIEWLTNKSFFIKGILEDNILNDVKATLLSGLESGQTPRETLLKIEEIYRPYVGTDIIADAKQVTPWRIETLTRTNLTGAFNNGRLAMSFDEDLKDYIEAWQLSAIIDTRTTDQCLHLDGKIIRKDDPDFGRIVPPLHYNCRSLLVPITIDDKPYKTIRRQEMDKSLALIPEGFGGRIGQ